MLGAAKFSPSPAACGLKGVVGFRVAIEKVLTDTIAVRWPILDPEDSAGLCAAMGICSYTLLRFWGGQVVGLSGRHQQQEVLHGNFHK